MALVIVLSAAPVVSAERTFTLRFKTSTIDKLIKRVAEETGRTILFDASVRGNISVVTQRPVTEDEAWAILESSLSILRFSLLPSTVGHWRIAKLANAVGEAPFIAQAGDGSDSFVTTLISLERAKIQSVLKVLEPLSGARVTLVPYAATNSLIASGSERAIARLMEIARELDRVDELTLRYRVLRYRDVVEVEPLIEARVESMGTAARRLQVWSDERTNSVLFRGGEEDVARLAAFLDRIDQPARSSGRIQVLRVLNRDPEEMATLIGELAGSTTTSARVAQIRMSNSSLSGAEFSIAVDKASRSLVVRASPDVQIAIREMLEQLDDPPQQIAVDLTISEIRTPRSQGLGFAFSLPLGVSSDPNDLFGVIVSSPVAGATAARIPGPETTVYGRIARDTGVVLEGPDGPDGLPVVIPIEYTGVIQGADFIAETEVLLQPHLIVTSGERHEIFVGTNIPVPVSEGGIGEADLNSPLGVTLSRTIRFDRTDIGIRLGIDATAGRDGKIRLDLDLEISTLVPSLAGPIETVGPSFLKETLTVTARLDHGETAIIGLNRQSREIEARQGVPWLSSIPFIGWLFTANLHSVQDVKLVIAARARRLSSPAALVADTIRRRIAFQRRNAMSGMLARSESSPFAVRVTTRRRLDDADAIAEGLTLSGHHAKVHSWSDVEGEYFDVYVVSLESMMDASDVARELMQAGWDPDVVLLPAGS
jgi:general secretion pathway protein D